MLLAGHLLSQVEEQAARLPCNRGQGKMRLTPEGGRKMVLRKDKVEIGNSR